MDGATSKAQPPTDQEIDEATQALLSRNATIIHTLIRECTCHSARPGSSALPCSSAAASMCRPEACNHGSTEHVTYWHCLPCSLLTLQSCIRPELSRQRGAEPMPREAALAAEAFDNLAAVALTFSPAELAAPPAPRTSAAGAAAPIQPAAQPQKPHFSAAAAARSLGLLPPAPPVADAHLSPAAALRQGLGSGALPPAATAAARGVQQPQAAAGGLHPPPRQLAAVVAHPQPLQRLPSRDAHPSGDHRLVWCRTASQYLKHGARLPRLPHVSHGW
jgi:hypothetical protein